MNASEEIALLISSLKPGHRVQTTGLAGAARAWVLARATEAAHAPLVCVTADDDTAAVLASDLAFFMGGSGTSLEPRVLHLPADDALPWEEVLSDPTRVTQRLGVLAHLALGTAFPALVLSVRALVQRVMPIATVTQFAERVTVGQEVGRDALARRLIAQGYRSTPLVEDTGTFSLRGDILDVFAPLHEDPVRLEFFGETVESMRRFDPQTQRTIDAIPMVMITVARELFFTEATKREAEAAMRRAAEGQHLPTAKVREKIDQVRDGLSVAGLRGLWPGFFRGGLESVFDFLKPWHPSPLFWLDEPALQAQTLDALEEEVARSHAEALAREELTLSVHSHFLLRGELEERLRHHRMIEGGGISLSSSTQTPISFHYGSTHSLREAIRSHHGEEGALTPLVERLSTLRREGTTPLIACGTLGQADRLRRLLADRGATALVHASAFDARLPPGDGAALAHLYAGEISSGFVDSRAHLAVFSDEDIFSERARRHVRRKKSAFEGLAASFRNLKEGDLCVHAEFGVCRSGGLLTMQVNGVSQDFLVLQFAGRDRVYLPVGRLRLVSKFTGQDPSKVMLDRLGSNAFERRKALVKEGLLKMAAELLALYAERKAHPGFAFSAPDRYFRQFEADFEFEETVDQQRAIDDVLLDMQAHTPMDRLVCGDVGYGKTEVAMRAAFKAVLDHKQVAVLVPTTLLAHQHLSSFRRRFEGYPVTVDVVSSLRKQTDVRQTFARALEGRLDVLIGTHKLLNSSVGFRDLGLLIIDEEQRFGVKQKEALRRLKTTVDTLTLTATPIPRTMNMAMSGLRDLSLIATAPQDRRAIRTFVNTFDEQQIREAILQEVQRGGQVFFIHNRVQSLGSMERFLRRLVPSVSLAVAHGQMSEGRLEKAMLDFVEKRAQVLLSTSIVESGLDIPSANTMIVNRADQFGLAQLYQLRGRVGRSKERAYAYLFIPKGRALTRMAARRLEVLQAFTELGAGFSIASHDLEIRGAGSLLGQEQSGSIEAVGFELYTQLLEEAIAEVRGEAPRETVEPDLNLPVAAYLPETYVPDVQQRLALYKRFSQAQVPEDLLDLRSELVDRFGELPPEVEALQEIMLLKIQLRDLAVRQLEAGPGRLVVTLGKEARLDPARVAGLVQASVGLYRLTPEMKLIAKAEPMLRGAGLIEAAKKVLRDVASCASDPPPSRRTHPSQRQVGGASHTHGGPCTS